MSLSNAFMCREIAPGLLDDNNDPTDSKIRNRIRDAESKIFMWLANRYATPLLPNTYLTGTITVYKGSSNITGTSTTFTDLQIGQTIQIVSTGEALQIETIENDTLITCNSEVVSDASGSTFWVIPDELVTASKYLATHLTIMLHFPEKTLKQDNVEKFDRRMEYFAGDILKKLSSGDYFNSDLIPTIATEGRGRLFGTVIDQVVRTRINNNHTFINSDEFI